MTSAATSFWGRATCLVLLLMAGVYFSPALLRITHVAPQELFRNEDGMGSAWLHSLFFAFSSTLLNCTAAMVLATLLFKRSGNTGGGKWLVMLIFPALLGNVSVAFISKLIFADAAFVQRFLVPKFLTMLLIQFWQYGSLLTYLFWLAIFLINRKKWFYSAAMGLTPAELLRDIVLPSLKNIVIVCAIINFAFAFVEDARIQMVFMGSAGTDSEFVSQWLNRLFQSNALLDPGYATAHVFEAGWSLVGLAFVFLLLLVFSINMLVNRLSRARRAWDIPDLFGRSKQLKWLIAALIAAPVVFVFIQYRPDFAGTDVELFSTILLTAAAAVLATGLAVTAGILLRLFWRDIFKNGNRRSYLVITALLLTQLLPSIFLVLAGYRWLALADMHMAAGFYLVWIAGHCTLALPVLLSFIIVAHFKLADPTLEFLDAHRADFREKLAAAFLAPFAGDYLFTLLFAFALIWNEGTINSLLSDYIPSFVSEMKMSMTGRALDYARGEKFFFVSVGIALGACLLWFNLSKKIFTEHEDTGV